MSNEDAGDIKETSSYNLCRPLDSINCLLIKKMEVENGNSREYEGSYRGYYCFV